MAEFLVAHLSDLKMGSMIDVQAGDRSIVLFRDEQGAVFALDDCCSHAEVQLSGGSFADGIVECPAHGAKFDVRTGRPLCMPAVAPVQSFVVRVVDNPAVFRPPIQEALLFKEQHIIFIYRTVTF